MNSLFYDIGNPRRHGKYKDGRSLDRAAYKHEHYLDNIDKYKARGKAFYYANKVVNGESRE